MKPYPTTFAVQAEPVVVDKLSSRGSKALTELLAKGYRVCEGLTTSGAAYLQQLAQEPSIVEYCPNDRQSRFRDEPSTANWLSQGRAVFVLEEITTGQVAGYAWVGNATSEHVKNGAVTAALRLSERHQGKGLAVSYLAAVIDAAQQTYGARGLWLESWESNAGAMHIYQKLGFIPVQRIETTRPTGAGSQRTDARVYMTLPDLED